MPNFISELDDEDTQTLIEILYSCTWKSGEVDTVCDYYITSAGKIYRYSTSAGILMNSSGYISLSNENRLIVNEIITTGGYRTNFSSITLMGNDELAKLPDSVAQHILNALNRAEWHKGDLEITLSESFECDNTLISYSNGVFTAANWNWYWYADSYTADCLDALLEAVNGIYTGDYDTIIYYAGAYYGHSDAVDEKLQGTVNFSMNIHPQFLDDILYAHNGQQTVSRFGDIVDCKNSVDLGVLVTINGYYFERITEFDPDFSQGDVILTPYGQPPVEASEEDAQKLREIFSRAEFEYCFGDHAALYETTIKIGGYTVAYLSSWGDAKIGDWKATLSEQDCAAVAGILGGYIYVE